MLRQASNPCPLSWRHALSSDASCAQAGSEQPHRTWKQARRIGWAVGLALMPMIVLAEYVQVKS